MPATVIVSKAEADFLRAEGVKGIDGFALTYEPRDTLKLLNAVSKKNPAYPTLAARLAGVAGQLGCPDVMFAKPAPEPAAAPAVEAEAPVSQAQELEHSPEA